MGAARSERNRLREKPQQIADELRRLIVSGELSEGDSLGHEPDLVERFGVSRPSFREALRILEAEGLITVVRGVRGGVVVHEPDRADDRPDGCARAPGAQRAARRRLRSPHAARTDRGPPSWPRRGAGARRPPSCSALVDEQERRSTTPRRSAWPTPGSTPASSTWPATRRSASWPRCCSEIVARAVVAASQADQEGDAAATRRRGLRSQRRLLALVEAGDAAEAEEHWRKHMAVVGRVMLGRPGRHGDRPDGPLLRRSVDGAPPRLSAAPRNREPGFR